MEIIEYDAFDPDVFHNYESPKQVERSNKIFKIIIITVLLLVIATVIYKAFKSQK